MAGLVGMLAGLVARDQFQHAQRRLALREHRSAARIERQAPARRLRGQEEHLVDALLRHGLEHREQGADGLADAGRRLRHQAARRCCWPCRWSRPGGAGRAGSRHAGSAARVSAASRAARCAISCAAQADEALAQVLEHGSAAQRAVALFAQHGFAPLPMSKYTSARLTCVQAALLAQQVAVDAHLGPVQVAVVVGHGLEGAAVGLDFFEQVLRRVVAVGAAAHEQAVRCRRTAALRLW